jgi:hypothetical protein
MKLKCYLAGGFSDVFFQCSGSVNISVAELRIRIWEANLTDPAGSESYLDIFVAIEKINMLQMLVNH